DQVEILLNAGAAIEGKNRLGTTALMWAVAHGNTEVVARLLARGADVNAANTNGLTALHLSVSVGKPELVETLLAAGANPKAKTAAGETALMRARLRRQTNIGCLLRNAGAAELP